MGIRESLTDYSKGNNLKHFWKLYNRSYTAKNKLSRDIWTFFMSRSAHRHGGYIGPGALIKGIPSLPHGLHGIFISRYAVIGRNCRIYQNVTIGEVNGHAPTVGDNCLIGAGAVLVGGIHIGKNVKIGEGAVISSDVPDGCTVVSQAPRILKGS